MTTVSNMDITDDDKLWALLAYLFPPLLGIILLLLDDKKNRPFIKYNAVNSIMLGVVSIVLSFLCVGILLWFYSIYLGIKAYQGEMVTIPVLTDFGKKQGWL
jgi:uncharacterized protein